jgi:drug/metabolite transporter superfamily protein YnfA
MRAGSIVAVLTLAIFGVMFADLETHSAGTTAAANGIVAIEKPGLSALSGNG